MTYDKISSIPDGIWRVKAHKDLTSVFGQKIAKDSEFIVIKKRFMTVQLTLGEINSNKVLIEIRSNKEDHSNIRSIFGEIRKLIKKQLDRTLYDKEFYMVIFPTLSACIASRLVIHINNGKFEIYPNDGYTSVRYAVEAAIRKPYLCSASVNACDSDAFEQVAKIVCDKIIATKTSSTLRYDP